MLHPPRKPHAPTSTPIRKHPRSSSRTRKKKIFDHAPETFEKRVGPRVGVNPLKGPGIVHTNSSQMNSTSTPKLTSPSRTLSANRLLYERPQGSTAGESKTFEIPMSEVRREEMQMTTNTNFKSRLDKEEAKRKKMRRVTQQELNNAKRARKQDQYVSLAKAINVGHEDGNFCYERGLLPGDLLFQFLAPRPKINSETGAEEKPVGKRRLRTKSMDTSRISSPRKENLKRLRMWMPDTIVYSGRDGPMWLY